MSKNEKKKVERKVATEKEERSLKVNLTNDELLAFGIELADAEAKKTSLADELQEVKSRYKSEIDEVDSRINNIGGVIRCKYQFRKVECEKTLNFSKGIVSVMRMDTAEIVETREMLDYERQAEIPACKEEKKK